MNLQDVQKLLNATVHTGQEFLDRTVETCCGSDLMSDVLAYAKDQVVLITGLLNAQVIRTALMMDMNCIIFVRSKTPDQNMIDLAREHEIVVMATDKTMYAACGILYSNGLAESKEEVR